MQYFKLPIAFTLIFNVFWKNLHVQNSKTVLVAEKCFVAIDTTKRLSRLVKQPLSEGYYTI